MRPLPALRPELKIGYSPFGDLPATLRTLRKDRRLFDGCCSTRSSGSTARSSTRR
ncbi:MAG: hypothetical protein R3F60_29145 [bacterium]